MDQILPGAQATGSSGGTNFGEVASRNHGTTSRAPSPCSHGAASRAGRRAPPPAPPAADEGCGDRADPDCHSGPRPPGARARQHRRIQIQREARLGTTQQPQQPAPQRRPETLDARLSETMEESTHRVGPRPTGQVQQRGERAGRAGHFRVRETARAHHHADEESRQRVARRDGVGTGQRPRQMCLHLAGITDLVQEGDEAGQPPKGVTGRGVCVSLTLAEWKKEGLEMSASFCSFLGASLFEQTHSASDPRNRTTFFHLSFSGLIGLNPLLAEHQASAANILQLFGRDRFGIQPVRRET